MSTYPGLQAALDRQSERQTTGVMPLPIGNGNRGVGKVQKAAHATAAAMGTNLARRGSRHRGLLLTAPESGEPASQCDLSSTATGIRIDPGAPLESENRLPERSLHRSRPLSAARVRGPLWRDCGAGVGLRPRYGSDDANGDCHVS